MYFSSNNSGAINSGVPAQSNYIAIGKQRSDKSNALVVHTDDALRVGLHHRRGQAKVSQLYLTIVIVYEDIVAFQIAMDDWLVSLAVKVMQGLQNLPAPISACFHVHLFVQDKADDSRIVRSVMNGVEGKCIRFGMYLFKDPDIISVMKFTCSFSWSTHE